MFLTSFYCNEIDLGYEITYDIKDTRVKIDLMEMTAKIKLMRRVKYSFLILSHPICRRFHVYVHFLEC